MPTTMMPLAEVLQLESGDWGGPMHKIVGSMDCERRRSVWQGWMRCEDYILEIALRMEAHGWDGPPVCVNDDFGESAGPTLRNGHHRVTAAWLLGLKWIPVTEYWDESEGPYDW